MDSKINFNGGLGAAGFLWCLDGHEATQRAVASPRAHLSLHWKPWEEYWESETALLLKSGSQQAGCGSVADVHPGTMRSQFDSGQGTCPG